MVELEVFFCITFETTLSQTVNNEGLYCVFKRRMRKKNLKANSAWVTIMRKIITRIQTTSL